MGKSVPPPDNQKQTERYIAYGFGVFFVIIMLALALFVPNPTPFQLLVFRVVLALAAAGVASMTPGFLEIDLGVRKTQAIRAGGALAIFVIVYRLNPASLVVVESAWRSDIEGLRGDIGALVVKWEQIDDDNERPCNRIRGKASQLGNRSHNIKDKNLGKFSGEKIAKYQYSQLAYLIASDVECDKKTAIRYARQSLIDGSEAINIIDDVEGVPGDSNRALRAWINDDYIRDRIEYYGALGNAVLHRYGDTQASQRVSEMLSGINPLYYNEEGIEPEENRLLAPIISSTSSDNQTSLHPCLETCGPS